MGKVKAERRRCGRSLVDLKYTQKWKASQLKCNKRSVHSSYYYHPSRRTRVHGNGGSHVFQSPLKGSRLNVWDGQYAVTRSSVCPSCATQRLVSIQSLCIFFSYTHSFFISFLKSTVPFSWSTFFS